MVLPPTPNPSPQGGGEVGLNARSRPLRRHLQHLLRARKPSRRRRGAYAARLSRIGRCSANAPRTAPSAWRDRCAAGARFFPPGSCAEARSGSAAASLKRLAPFRRARRSHRRPRAVLPAHACATSSVPCCPVRTPSAWPRHAFLLEEFLAREAAAGRIPEAIVRRQGQGPAAWALPPEGVRRRWPQSRARWRLCDGLEVRDRGVELLRHGRRLRLRRRYLRRFRADGRAFAPPRRAQAPRRTPCIAADGFSCRHQIRDGSGRTAVHVARILSDALAAAPALTCAAGIDAATAHRCRRGAALARVKHNPVRYQRRCPRRWTLGRPKGRFVSRLEYLDGQQACSVGRISGGIQCRLAHPTSARAAQPMGW